MKDLNSFLEKICIEWVNNYSCVAIRQFADDHNLTVKQAGTLIQLAKEVYYQDVEMTIIGLED